MMNAFRESLARIVELMIGVTAGLFLVGQFAESTPRLSSFVVALFLVGVIIVGALLAAWIHTSRIGRPHGGA